MKKRIPEKLEKADKRKIPQLFRAVERNERPSILYGSLISDDGFNFVSFSCHDGDESQFIERVESKRGP